MFQKTENVFAFLFSLFFVYIVYFMINLVDPKYRTHISQGNSCGTCYTCLVAVSCTDVRVPYGILERG